MIRRMDLLRQVLLDAEAHVPLAVDQPDEILNEHVRLLAEAGFVIVREFQTVKDRRLGVDRITWRGHEALTMMRDQQTWSSMSQAVESGMPLEVVLGAYQDRARQTLAERI